VKTDQASTQKQAPAAPRPKARLLRVLGTLGWGVLMLLGLAGLIQQAIHVGQQSNDFCQDYIAALRVFQGVSSYLPLRTWPLYATCTIPLKYDSHPPFSVLVVLPFGLLPRVAVLEVWAFLSLGFYLVSGALLLRMLGWWSLRGVALFLCGSFLWGPVGIAEGAGNFAQLLTLLLVLAWYLERKGKPGWAGAVLAGAGLVKIWPVVLLLNAALLRRWREVLAGGISTLGGTLATLPVLGLAAYAAYLGPVRLEETPEVPHEVNVSLVGAIARLWTGFRDPPVVTFPPLLSGLTLPQAVLLGEGVAGLVIVAALALVVWALWRAQGEAIEALCLGVVVTAMLVCFPITWNWGLITLLVPLATTVLALRQVPRPASSWYAALGLALVLLLDPVGLPLRLLPRWPAGASLLFGLPTMGLLLFLLVQALLLCWAVRRQARP
jgi:hypothetical protein